MVKKTVKKSLKKVVKKKAIKKVIHAKVGVKKKAPVKKETKPWKKGLVAGMLSGVALMILNFVMSLIPYSHTWYLDTFPGMMTAFASGPVIVSSFISGVIIGCLYSVFSKGIEAKGIMKGLCYGFKIWLIVGIPWLVMVIGLAPFSVWILDLVTSLVTYLFLGLVIDLVYRKV